MKAGAARVAETAVLRVQFLPVNQRWALVLGDSIVEVDGRRLWPCFEGLAEALEAVSLRVESDGRVV